MKKTLLFVAIITIFQMSAQKGNTIWRNVDAQNVAGLPTIRNGAYSEDQQFFQIDVAAIKNSLVSVTDKSAGGSGVLISIPNAAGQMEQFAVWEKSNFEPALQAQHPDIRSYMGKGITDKGATLFFSLSPKGIETMILRANHGSEFIEPYTKDHSFYVLFDSATRLKNFLPLNCKTEDVALSKELAPSTSRSSNHVFKTMRLALSCTGEYGTYHGGTVDGALAAMNATMTRVNGVYNVDLALQLNMIANESDIIYTDADTDPYSDASAMNNWNSELQANLTATIGAAAYDIGHLFGATGGGGNAGCIGCVCGSGKGSGITSPADGVPEGDSFDIDYVAHEMGHQCGGNHSFTYGYEGTIAQVEPGSGSTIMGYAGITGTTDIQAHSDAYFVYPNIQQIQDNLATKSCPVSVQTTNNTPTVNAGADYTIPKSTPFVLTGTGNDADAGDTLTYTWEENDVASTAQEGNLSKCTATKAEGPEFRSFTPVATPVRYFPALSKIYTNTYVSTWEALPSVSRDLNFTLTVRDNAIGGGQTKTDAMVVHVNGDVGPFQVTAPNTAVSVVAGSNLTVTWNVAGTTANGINTPYVDIYLSTATGGGFNTLLASAVPNDGSEVVTVPNIPGATNKIMVKGHDQIFFDVSNANFTITAPTATQAIAFSGLAGSQNKGVCSADSVSYDFNYNALAGYSAATTFSATGNPAGTTVSFSPASVTATGTVTMTVSGLNSAAAGFYTIAVTSTSGAITKTINFYMSLGFSPITLAAPADLAVAVSPSPTLSWNAVNNAIGYDVQVATDSGFTNIVAVGTTADLSYTVTGLAEATDYYWRVAPKNADCTGNFSEVRKFTTGHVVCSSTASTNIPVTITASGTPTITSTLSIPAGYSISDINATVKITHSYVSDLTVSLTSPAGTGVVLVSGQCGDANNINATFDDSGTALTCGTSPAIGGTIRPSSPLSAFNGEDSTGTWTLTVSDDTSGDGGTLTAWSLNICHIEIPLGVTDNTLFNFAVYPNPNNGSFNIQSDKFTADKIDVNVYDMRGRTIYTNQYNGSGNFNENIKLKNAQAGVYLLSVSDGQNKEVKRIVIQ